ncbi:MAG: methyltransferase domain-containing protein [Paludibacterium sp.]|uniref:class I SAM-dependent methyltransferase n=1 Tax=Paludibacterium sp. TaxID=1917523 RepID=UPI0025EA6775|nr:class I SAM-dependent methyltransferase [Paludibacterium sp.]MBV8046308.1 methyltransferase domain-containing protein [Paludibacterium sp.]MBV8648363.1 methyltransferase domain-containing protein [Paludibacterium sp.]
MADIHHAAARGFSQAADAYQRGRPDYPDALHAWLSDRLGVKPGRQVLELGAGTGKFTQLLHGTDATVCALEPVAAMRAQLQALLPDVATLDGRAEAIPLPDKAMDVVVCAQAFHWFANADALNEIHRVLKPGGRLGLIWNVRDESCDWVRQITTLIAPFETGVPRFHSGAWRAPFADGLFSLPEPDCFPHFHTGAPEHVIVDRILSVSFIAALPEGQREQVRQQLRDLIQQHPQLSARTSVSFPYRTEAYCCVPRA